MNRTSLIDEITQFGLTRQEAQIYLCLIQNAELTGYEVAKSTGISRSNTYSALAGLVEKGAAYLLEGVSSKYCAVSTDEFCDNKIRLLEKVKQRLGEEITVFPEPVEGYITVTGAKHIRNKIHHMIENAEQRIYISATKNRVDEFTSELEKAFSKQIKVVIITDEIPKFAKAQHYITERKADQFHLICDSKYVLTGEIKDSETDTCLFSGQSNFVNVLKEALRNEIKLIDLKKEE